MTKETARQRRAREAREEQEARERFQAARPMRLIKAMARAYSLNVDATIYQRYGDVICYTFIFPAEISEYGDPDEFSGPVDELSEYLMSMIEDKLNEVRNHRTKERRLAQVRDELLARLTEEERESLGLG